MNITLKAGLQSEFYLCLSRAFLVPNDPSAFDAFQRFLVQDLAELNESLEYPIAGELARLQQELEAIPDHAALLGIYSHLFLDPGSRIPINTGVYFDGAMMGGTVARMEECYRKNGLEKSDGFRDLADHVAVQLEFVSYLFDRVVDPKASEGVHMRGNDFLHLFVAAWAPRFVAEIEVAMGRLGPGANPFLSLARIVDIAANSDAMSASPVYASQRRQTAIEKARAKRAESGIAEEDLLEIEAKLAASGLDTAHLRVSLEGRDETLGRMHATPPALHQGEEWGR